LKTALITGSSGAIGAALLSEFEAAGYAVIGIDVTPPATVSSSFMEADLELLVTEPGYRECVIQRIRQKLGGAKLDVLVNSAAKQQLGPFAHLSDSIWHTTLNTNLLAPIVLIRSFFEDLSSTRGCVLNITSIHGELTKPSFSAYGTSKAALCGLTKALAVECGSRFRVNAIAPAAIDTGMLRAGFAGSPAGFEQLGNFHPTGKIGSTSEVAALAVAMCSPKFEFLNGSVVTLDGGISSRLHDPV
jgi:NAD(P)-dependent dehydrogenase (short-subunit alcohol dehydrogenase family)